jgi:pyrroloquinoline quinone (PQQ) biosynthesis protein C
MNIVTSWMEQGRAQEQAVSHAREAARLIRQLYRKIGVISAATEQSVNQLALEQLDQLSDSLFDFSTEEDLLAWLDRLN